MAEVSTIKIPDIPREKKDKYNLFLISDLATSLVLRPSMIKAF